ISRYPMLSPQAPGVGTGLVHECAHSGDRVLQPHKDRLAHQEMTNIEFRQSLDGSNRLDCIVGQTVTGMAFEPDGLSMFCRCDQACELALTDDALGMTIGPGMQLDNGCADRQCRIELDWVRFNEHRDTDAGCCQLTDDRLQMSAPLCHIEPAFGGPLLPPFG